MDREKHAPALGPQGTARPSPSFSGFPLLTAVADEPLPVLSGFLFAEEDPDDERYAPDAPGMN